MKATKDLTIIGLYTALLIGGQFVLFAVSGVEIVTLLFTAFAFYFGVLRGMALATTFSLLRCFVFGFFPNVLILYLVYYNLFAFTVGWLGNALKHKLHLKTLFIVVSVVALLTICFTMIDNVITPLFYRYNIESAKAYWTLSLTAVIPQTVCAVISVSLTLIPITRFFNKLNLKNYNI